MPKALATQVQKREIQTTCKEYIWHVNLDLLYAHLRRLLISFMDAIVIG